MTVLICEYLAKREGIANDPRVIPHHELTGDKRDLTYGAYYVHQDFNRRLSTGEIVKRKQTYVVTMYHSQTQILSSYKTLAAAIAGAERMAAENC